MSGIVSFPQLGNMGRCGNSLHQIMATWAYALKHNKTVLFPEWKYFKYFDFPFPTSDNIISAHHYNEPHFHYSEIPFFEGNVSLEGYFQSHLYHDDLDPTVLFELKDNWRKSIDELYEKINPRGLHTVSIHVRRSDYLNPGTNEYHGVLPIDYYTAAISEILYPYGISASKTMFIICSDDIGWCKEWFKGLGENTYFSETQSMASCKEDYDIIDMFLMARCSNNIIANSSFSYWSALLNKNPNKRVVAPAKWFGETGKNNNTKDLYLPEWIKI